MEDIVILLIGFTFEDATTQVMEDIALLIMGSTLEKCYYTGHSIINGLHT